MSLSDISDLTDLSTDEDDVPLAKRASKDKKAPKEYKITHILRAPRTAQYTAKSLYDQIIENAIDLEPEYQRDIVWQEEKQSGLIDSVLRNYYIPPIIFAVTVQDDGSELRTCIDGKQRLTSIQRFIDGQIPHKDSFTNEKLWFKSNPMNPRRKLLPQHLRTQFANKQIVCVEYTGLDGDQEREIFQRVQLGVALTPAERLQALVGPWSTVIREIQNHVLGEEGFEGYLDWGHARGRDFQCLATIGYLIENHPKTAVPGTKTLEKWLQKTEPVSTRLRFDLHETFRIFVTLARDKKYSGSLNRPTRVSPIEFVMIGVLIFLKRQTLSLTQISSAIEKMRKDVRASHQDIRSNARVTKHILEFIAKRVKVSELRSDGEGDKPAALAVANATKPVKRKRPTHLDDSDTEPITKLKPVKRLTNSVPDEAAKSLKLGSSSSGPKMNDTKKPVAAPISKTSLTAKSSQPSTLSRATNNSLSNLFPIPAKKPPSPTPTTQSLLSGVPQPPPSAPTGHDVRLGAATSDPARRAPLTIQTGPAVKSESSQMSTLNSPNPLSAVDRLAPIRAAKASLASGTGAQSPVNKGTEMRGMPSPGADTPKTPVDLRQNPAAPHSAPNQTTVLSQQPPRQSPFHPPLPPVSSSSQFLPANSGQGRPIPPQVEGVLRSLRLQFPQLASRTQGVSDGAVNPVTSGQNVQLSGTASHPTMLPPMPVLVNPDNATSHGHGVNGSQGGHIGSTTSTQAYLNQASGPNAVPLQPSMSSHLPGNVTSQPPPTANFSTPPGLHALPQRPVVITSTPSNSVRAEPLGPPSRSTSSEGAIPDGRRGSYSKDRHRPPDDRRPNRHDRNQDFYHEKRNWFRSRP